MSIISQILGEKLTGPACPCCHRDDGSHNFMCPVPKYITEWKRLRGDLAQKAVDALFGETEK